MVLTPGSGGVIPAINSANPWKEVFSHKNDVTDVSYARPVLSPCTHAPSLREGAGEAERGLLCGWEVMGTWVLQMS